MEVYKSETREIIRRFLARSLSFPACICALDAALAGLVPRLTCEQLPSLLEAMRVNDAAVTDEMRRRSGPSAEPS